MRGIIETPISEQQLTSVTIKVAVLHTRVGEGLIFELGIPNRVQAFLTTDYLSCVVSLTSCGLQTEICHSSSDELIKNYGTPLRNG